MTKSELTDLLSKAKAATPGPWFNDIKHHEGFSFGLKAKDDFFILGHINTNLPEEQIFANTGYIAACSPEAITALVTQHLEALEMIEILKTAAGEYSFDGVPKEVWDQYHEFMRKIGET